ncbi:MAG: UxaA family hydrolase [SAR324 cluster bacterium]|nr:UxaA family hydrolase [SAR324 cluster bacterium]
MSAVDFHEIGRIPAEGDNAAIATRRLEAGTAFVYNDRAYRLPHTLLEGHRFAIADIAVGDPLLSWGLPFGKAVRPIAPGEYLCNSGILEALRQRSIDFTLPGEPNFEDRLEPHELDEAAFRPGRQVELHAQPGTFQGYPRPGGRGVGTRNDIVILGTTSLTGGYARVLEARLKTLAADYPNIDGIVSVTHTEGGGAERPNNLEFLLRTLSGFVVHPNIGAVLAVDFGTEVVTNAMLEDYLNEHGYPLEHVPHRFLTIESDFPTALEAGERIVRDWLEPVNGIEQSAQPLSELKIALQCGGSDAFSGVAGNPLAGWVAKELIKHGGSANLAETDELIGAEPYILDNTRDLETARRFLDKIAVFKERVSWHGHSAEGNPSGGNKFRGLYNIFIKSIGAARKKDPEVRLDYVIDYGERMTKPGYYFMDSPGNDLESIAGQVASGANMIFFITGNGSVTNFPFVPTIKFVTTTGRFDLLSKDMDVNAGRYQDGTPMDELGRETFEYTCRVASGLRSVGERAGHSQVSIWRDWRQTDGSRLEELRRRPVPDGAAIPIAVDGTTDGTGDGGLPAWPTASGGVTGVAIDRVALVVPTSLCAAQIARKTAEELNGKGFAEGRGISRVVALVHTEGCGVSGGDNEEHFTRTMIGHLLHPMVKEAVLLEHGCEKIHNDAMRNLLRERGIPLDRFGWASVQLDGGIDSVLEKVESLLAGLLPVDGLPRGEEDGAVAFSLGLLAVRGVPDEMARALARLTAAVVRSGGTVVVPENAALLASEAFLQTLRPGRELRPSLDYGQPAAEPGLHVMATPTTHVVETITGLGGTGVQVMLAHVTGPPLQAHPMIPLVQITADANTARKFHRDLDRVFGEGADAEETAVSEALLRLILDTASCTYAPKLWAEGNIDFQFTRGLLGLSL